MIIGLLGLTASYCVFPLAKSLAQLSAINVGYAASGEFILEVVKVH